MRIAIRSARKSGTCEQSAANQQNKRMNKRVNKSRGCCQQWSTQEHVNRHTLTNTGLTLGRSDIRFVVWHDTLP